MILREYSSNRLDLNYHSIERFEIFQNNKNGVGLDVLFFASF